MIGEYERRKARRPPERHGTSSWLAPADEGAVTAEFAMALPAVIIVATLILALTRTMLVTMDCQDAASAAARELVVNGDAGDAAGMVRAVAGENASVEIQREGRYVTVTTQCPVLPGPLNLLPTKVGGQAVGVTQ